MTTRERILDTADDLFGEKGFDAATTREIAERSGVNKALIHYHFATKDDLFRAVLDRYYARLTEALVGALAQGGDLQERLGRLLDTYVDFLAENRSFSRMVQREASGGRHVEPIVNRMVPLFETGLELVRQARRGAAPDAEAAHLLVSFYGMVVTYFTYAPVLERLLGRDPLSTEALIARKQHLRRMLELAIGEPGGSEVHPPGGENP
jgi:TetR/AcrR family transcriptional regulator